MEALRIAILTHIYPLGTSHAGAFVQARVDLYRKMGHEVDVFARGMVESPSAGQYDIAAAHYPLPEFVIPLAERFFPRTPVVAFLHGSEAISRGTKDLHPYRIKTRWMLKRFLRKCQASVTESRWMQEQIWKYLGIRPHVIPNPVDPSLFPLMSHGSTKGLCLRGKEWKYGSDVLDAIRPALATREIVVDNLEPVFARSDLPALLGGYGFFVAPSRLEGQGLMACEAAATGMPVVATRVGGIPEFIADEESVLIPESSEEGLRRAIVEVHGKLPIDEERMAGIRRSILSRCGPEVTVDKDIGLFKSLSG